MGDIVDFNSKKTEKAARQIADAAFEFGVTIDGVIIEYIKRGVNPVLLGGVLIRRAIAVGCTSEKRDKAREFLVSTFKKYLF